MTPIYPASDPRSGWDACPSVPSATFPAELLLARILEGNDEALPLSGPIGDGDRLRAALSALPASRRRRLEADFGGRIDSLLALSTETTPENFFAELFEIARGLEVQERYESAGRLYMTITALNRHPECNPARRDLAERAQARLNFLSGHGTWRDYGELFLRQTIDPSDLVAFGLAGITSRTLRFGTLGRILQARTRFAGSRLTPWWTRGLAPKLIAGSVGLGIEAPTFVVASHFADTALGRNPNWSGGALNQELRDSYLLFTRTRALMVFGSLFARHHMGITSLRAATRRQRMIHEGAVQMGIVGGLFFAHAAQNVLGSNPNTAASVESLADGTRLYLQFNAMRGPAAWFLRPRIGGR